MAFWEGWDCSCCCCFCEWWGQWLQRRRQRRRWRRRHGLSEEDIEFLKMELRSIHGALRLAGAVPSEQLSPHLKYWADQSREVSYDIQDILDTFLVRVKEAHPDSSKGLVSKTRRQIAESIIDVKIFVHEIGVRRARDAAGGFLGADAIRVQEIAERPSRNQADTIAASSNPEIAERPSRYQADTIAASANPWATRVDTGLLDMINDEKLLVGTGEAMEEVIRMLSMDTDDTSNGQLKTVCIVGAEGLGKTTLASAVYQKLQPLFDCSAFVSLPPNPNISRVLSSILQQLKGKQISEASGDEEQLVDQLAQLLQDKRYLIAVDDIRDEKSWKAIRGAMVDKNLGSRIITTTQSHEVAAMHAGGVYKLRRLSDYGSKILFYKKIFGREVTYDEVNQLNGILVDKILKKCGGLPLAIVSVAGFLASKPTEVWYKVVKSISLQSYYHLPSHLKSCILYTSIFPKNYMIRRDRLVWRWIAEGFIEGKEGCSLFQIGQEYLDELLNRSLIVVGKDDVTDGMTKYCCVDDIELDLSCSLASDANFATILVDGQEQRIFRDKVIRRLSLQNSPIGRRAVTLDVGHVRSVSVFGTGINLMPPLSSFHILRVLDLEGCDLRGSNNPKHLGKLLHLRYLGLRGTNVFQQLPKDIGNLSFLQVLDLKGNSIRELPSTVALLHKLLCLYTEPDTRIPKGMGNLTSLEELSKISIGECPRLMKELNSLVELRVLDIVLKQGMGETSEKDLLEYLCNLHKLQTLGIYGHHSELDFMTKEGWAPPPGLCRFMAVDCWFSVLPKWISNARNLSALQIGVRELWREDLQSLGGLQELHFLCLVVERMGEERLVVDVDVFPNLTHLRISAETCLVFRPGAMPKIEVLDFLGIDKVQGDISWDWDLSNLPSLKSITAKEFHGQGKMKMESKCGFKNITFKANSASANKEEAKAAHAVESHPNHPKPEVTMVTSQNKQMESVDENVASSSEIQEERYAI